jgi:hypothetical protein
MRALVIVLGITTIGLAVASGYLYRQLRIERSHGVALDARESSRGERAPVAGAESPSMIPVEETSDEVESSALEVERSDRSADAATATRAQRLAQRRAEEAQRWADPAFRSRALVRVKYQARERNPDLGSALRMNASQEGAFVDLLARQQLEMERLNSQIRLASDAERVALQQEITALNARHQQERSEHLGPVRYQQYQDYQQQMPERQQLRELRSRLDETNSLTAAQSSRLIAAMYQERDSYLQQIKTLENFGGYSLQYPIEARSRDRDPAVRIRFAEEQVTRTEEFQSRLRMSASQVLSAEQLRRFDEIQEEQLAMVQARVERIRNQANRRGSGQRRSQ